MLLMMKLRVILLMAGNLILLGIKSNLMKYSSIRYMLSFESTPSDFDENDSEKFRMMTEIELLKIYVSFLNEMNTDLVFMGNISKYLIIH